MLQPTHSLLPKLASERFDVKILTKIQQLVHTPGQKSSFPRKKSTCCTGLPRHREFGGPFFQTGKTQRICICQKY